MVAERYVLKANQECLVVRRLHAVGHVHAVKLEHGDYHVVEVVLSVFAVLVDAVRHQVVVVFIVAAVSRSHVVPREVNLHEQRGPELDVRLVVGDHVAAHPYVRVREVDVTFPEHCVVNVDVTV